MARKIILFELNELPFRILDEFARWRPNSVLARRRGQFRQFETITEDVTHLSPWLTWPSFYRGVNDERHQIYNFGQDLARVDEEFPPLWKLLTAHGVQTGLCGTLHTYPPPENLENYRFYLPDTFAAGSECFPRELSAFQDFNLSMARQSAKNIGAGVPWGAALRFLARAPGLGLRLGTMADVGGQVLAERAQPWKRNRRRSYQSVLAFDVFMRQLEATRPDFVTFFTNHVASAMHRFWAAAFPSDYAEVEFTEEWIQRYCGEIDFAMRKFDDMLERLLRFVDGNREYELWVATSMGQAATRARVVTSLLYPMDLPRHMRALGLDDEDWKDVPSMFGQLNVFVTESKRAAFREQLKGIAVAGEPLDFAEADSGFFSLWWGQENMHERGECVTLHGKILPMAEAGLECMAMHEHTGSNAYHIPQGCLLIYDPNERPESGSAPPPQISALDVAPTLLRHFGVPVPAYMHRPAPLAAG